MKIEYFDGSFYAESGAAFYGPFPTAEAAAEWWHGRGPLATRVLDPMGRPYTPTPKFDLKQKRVTAPRSPRYRRPPPPPKDRDWFAMLAWRQGQWERRHALLRASETGATQKALGAFLGVTGSRVRVLIDRACRDRHNRRRPPLAVLNEPWLTRDLALSIHRSLQRSVALVEARQSLGDTT